MTTPRPPATTVYCLGQSLTGMAVCAPAGLDAGAVAAEVNRTSPTGISSGWQYDPKLAQLEDGGPNPRPCPGDQEGRRHWLLDC